MIKKSIEVPDLLEVEKMAIPHVCKAYPTYLKEYLDVETLPSLEEVTREVSDEFNKIRHNKDSLEHFYTTCNNYLIQLVLYAANPGRIQSLCKRLRILKYFGIKEVVDFGSGAGIDGFVYSASGIKTLNVEYPNASRKFARWVFRKKNINSDRAVFISPDIFMSIVETGVAKFRAVQAIEVAAHLKDPYTTFANIMKKSSLFMWTNDIGLHRDDVGRDPQHLDHSLPKVIKSLDEYGEKVKIKKMAIPPRLWINKKEKKLWKKRQ